MFQMKNRKACRPANPPQPSKARKPPIPPTRRKNLNFLTKANTPPPHCAQPSRSCLALPTNTQKLARFAWRFPSRTTKPVRFAWRFPSRTTKPVRFAWRFPSRTTKPVRFAWRFPGTQEPSTFLQKTYEFFVVWAALRLATTRNPPRPRSYGADRRAFFRSACGTEKSLAGKGGPAASHHRDSSKEGPRYSGYPEGFETLERSSASCWAERFLSMPRSCSGSAPLGDASLWLGAWVLLPSRSETLLALALSTLLSEA